MEIKNHHRRITLFRHESDTHARIVATFNRRTPTFPDEWEHWPQDEHLPMEIWRSLYVGAYINHHLEEPGYFAVAVSEEGTGDVEYGPVRLHVERRSDDA